MNLFDNTDYVFNCPYMFRERFSGGEDYFKPREEIEPDPVRGLAMRRTNLIPDVVRCELPLSTTAVRRAIAASNRRWAATASTYS
jgi:hypothetical protein